MLKKFKLFVASDTPFEITVLVLVAISAFGLGRLSVAETSVSPLKLVASPAAVESVGLNDNRPEVLTEETGTTKQIVASKNGNRYHLVSCPGAKQINEENKLYFNSRSEAEAAGYTPAGNCPRLSDYP